MIRPEALAALRDYQQADEEGVVVLVSRQAIEEVLAGLKWSISPERLACEFHERYERLARQFGYETREESAKPWMDVPENNRRLMMAVCEEVLRDFFPSFRTRN